MGKMESEKLWAAQYPEMGTGLVSVTPNISQEYFEAERDKIFKKTWLNVCRVETVPKPGDYLVKDLPGLQTSIIVVRGKDGKIRSFHNICKHRGNQVALPGTGSAQGFVCHFHGWTYDLEGTLTVVPDEGQFHDFDRKDFRLSPIATDVWEGFIFINLDPHPAESLKEYLGELYDQFNGYFNNKPLVASYEVTVNANWKLAIDAFTEAYHVNALHRRSAYDPFASKDNPYCHASSVRLYKRHRGITLPANPGFKPTPAAMVAFKHGGPAAYITTGKGSSYGLPPGVNPDRLPIGEWGFDIGMVFPTFLFATGNSGYFVTERHWPISANKFFWEVDVYMGHNAKNWGERISQEYTKAMLIDVSLEDLSTLERTQVSLESGAMTHMILSDQEIAPRHNYKVVADYVGHR